MVQFANSFTEQDTQFFRDLVVFENGFGIIADVAWNIGSGSGNTATSSMSVLTPWNGIYFPDPAYNSKFANGNADDSAFVVGGATVTASGSKGSFAQGQNAKASGSNGSFSQGFVATASGYQGSFAQGFYSTSTGNNGSFAQGLYVSAFGDNGSFAQGNYAIATGDKGSFAQGANSTSNGKKS